MEYKRVLAIGDIHGEWDKFISLYEKIDFNSEEDLLIFLGDYVDRGSKPLHVLDWMYEHRNENFKVYDGDALVVVGHTPTPYLNLPPQPHYCRNKKVILADTGAFMAGGRLSCVDVLKGTFIQDNGESGMIKDSDL